MSYFKTAVAIVGVIFAANCYCSPIAIHSTIEAVVVPKMGELNEDMISEIIMDDSDEPRVRDLRHYPKRIADCILSKVDLAHGCGRPIATMYLNI